MNPSNKIIEVKNLYSSYTMKGKEFCVVQNASFVIQRGETLGLVGESGCGKTTIGKLLLGLIPPSSGEVLFEGRPVHKMNKSELFELRRNCQMIFQDPYGSVNPRMTIQEIILEPLHIYKIGTLKQRNERVQELLLLVGLDNSFSTRYPHELSGGQRQRVVIARALAPGPKFLICDEPIAALDVSIQAQIINLFKELQEKLGLTYLLISHDLAVVKYLATSTLVMYHGQIIEKADNDELYQFPLHPYTSALIDSIPIPDPELEKKRRRLTVWGEPPSPFEEVHGCPFASRCQKRLDICSHVAPLPVEARKNHSVSCHLFTSDHPNHLSDSSSEKEYETAP